MLLDPLGSSYIIHTMSLVLHMRRVAYRSWTPPTMRIYYLI